MRKRLTMALVAGTLMAAMVPGVASANPGARVLTSGQCVKLGYRSGADYASKLAAPGVVIYRDDVEAVRAPQSNNDRSAFTGTFGYHC